MASYQILVKLLDGKTRCIGLPHHTVPGESVKRALHAETGIPFQLQRLVTGLREIRDETLISAAGDGAFPTCTLLLRLRGGKGGFGSLLRGAATKAGQKKTSNFDACRDMSGRRLRHVNAEKKLEEWKAGAEERQLEKIAEQFLKKKAKEVKKTASKEVEKYIEKYKEDSKRCMEEVEESVRQSFSLYEKSKRKALPTSGPGSKRLKMWLGKEKVDESDSDEDEEDGDSETENEKSVVIDDGGNQKSDSGSSGAASGSQFDVECSGGGSDRSNLEEENGFGDQNGRFEAGEGSVSKHLHAENDGFAEPQATVQEETSADELISSCSEGQPGSNDVDLEKGGGVEYKVMFPEQADNTPPTTSPENLPALENVIQVDNSLSENVDVQSTVVSSPEEFLVSNKVSLVREDSVTSGSEVHTETASQDSAAASSDEPLNFDNFNSASDLESLGMDRLKVELQANGLKIGGTLQERAARLFLLKTTPVDKLPKKVLAKPSNGGK